MGFNNDEAVDVFTRKTMLFPVEELIFMEHLKPPMRILDLGCGTGRTTRHLKDAGHHVTGVDISPKMITRATELHPDIVFRVADALILPFPDHSFDVVLFSFNGIDYAYPEEDRLSTIVEIYRIIKPGGLFIYSSHDAEWAATSPKAEFKRLYKKLSGYDGFYKKEKLAYGELVTYYGTPEQNHRTLRAAGFKRSIHYDLEGKGWRYYVAWA